MAINYTDILAKRVALLKNPILAPNEEKPQSDIFLKGEQAKKSVTDFLLKNPKIKQLFIDVYKNPKISSSQIPGDLQRWYNMARNFTPEVFKAPQSVSKLYPNIQKDNPELRTKALNAIYQQYPGGLGLQKILPPQEKTESQKLYSEAANKTAQLNLQGLVKKGIENGLLPNLENKNLYGMLGTVFTYPLNSFMQTISAAPRISATGFQAVLNNYFKKSGLNEQNIDSIADLFKAQMSGTYKVPEQINSPEKLIKTLLASSFNKDAFKTTAKAAVLPIVNPTSEYANTGYTQLVEKQGEGTKLTKEFEFTKDWEKGNWVQRLFSGFAGSPADILGLALDIIMDPLTYLSGGAGKGAKTGVKVLEDFVVEGTKILPQKAALALTKVGRKQALKWIEEAYPGVLKGLESGTISPAIFGIKATDFAGKTAATNIFKQFAYNQWLKSLNNLDDVAKFIDFGGLKFAGQTVVPGYKIAGIGKKIESTGLGATMQSLTNAQSMIPHEARTAEKFAISSAEASANVLREWFNKIIRTIRPSEADMSQVQKYMQIAGDAERAQNKLAQIENRIATISQFAMQEGTDVASRSLQAARTRVSNLLNKYANAMEALNLSEKQTNLFTKLKELGAFTAQQAKEAGIEFKNGLYDIYSPVRYFNPNDVSQYYKTSLAGSIEQPFQMARRISQGQAEALGLKTKDLISSWNQRIWEQQKALFRTKLIDQMRQFGFVADNATENAIRKAAGLPEIVKTGEEVVSQAPRGWVEISKIPELRGVRLPPEFARMFGTTYRTFFGDTALNSIVKMHDKALTIWKRLALATPGFHFRNWFTDNVSGMMEYGFKWWNPEDWTDAVKGLTGKGDDVLINGEKISAKTLQKEMLETGASVTQSSAEGLAGLGSRGSLTELSLRVGNKRENLGRAVAYIIERKAGASPMVAAEKVKDIFFDYAHSLTAVEQKYGKRMFPFITWLKNNARRQMELLLTRTGRYAAIPKVENFVENISDKPENYDTYKPEFYTGLGAKITPLRNPGLPDWLADLSNKPRTEEAGVPLVSNVNLAFQDISRLNPSDLGSASSPIIKTIAELLFNKNLYYGTPIYGREAKRVPVSPAFNDLIARIPEKVQNWIGLKEDSKGEVTMSPLLSYLMSLLPQYATANRGFAGTESSPFQNFSVGTGLKYFPYNEEKSKTYYYSDWLAQAKSLYPADDMPSQDEFRSALKELWNQYNYDKYNMVEVDKLKMAIKLGYARESELKDKINAKSKDYNLAMNSIKGMSLSELRDFLVSRNIDVSPELVKTTIDKVNQAKQLSPDE